MKVYKKRITRYHTPDGRRCPKGTPEATKKIETSTFYYGRINGKEKSLCADKGESKKMLANLIDKSTMADLGMVDPYAEHRQRPIMEHVADYIDYIRAKQNGAEYVQKTEAHLCAIVQGCKIGCLGDITETVVMSFLAKLLQSNPAPALEQDTYKTSEVAHLLGVSVRTVLRLTRRKQLPTCGRSPGSGPRKLYHRDSLRAYLDKNRVGIGPATANHYLTAIKMFTKWLVTKGKRMAIDPLSHLSRFNQKVDRRHRRRALSEELFGKFLNAVIGGKPYRGLTGRDRFFLYSFASNTGFRAGELASLKPENFDLATLKPTSTVEAAYSKRRREDKQLLRDDVADLMRAYLRDKPFGVPLWAGTWSDSAAEMVRCDLEAAGIPYQDERGRFFDFHALRGQFITMLIKHGVHPKVAQILARHSTIVLTMDCYTDEEALDLLGALDQLPPVKKLPEVKKDEEAA